MEIIVQ